ncbi:MAG: efflux RND transporter periplasmic adaptor subunit [Candidatus Cloacimonadales bacterium]
MKKVIISVIFISLVLVGCGQRPSGRPAAAGKPQEEAITVMVEEVSRRDLKKFVRVTGKIRGIHDVSLSSEVNGKVVEIYKNLGERVEAGEAIARIDNSEYEIQLEQAKASLLAAEASWEMANLNLDAAERLYAQQQISENEYLQTKSNAKNAQALVKGAAATVQLRQRALDNSKFVAPIAGNLAELNLEIGEMVNAGKIVAGIVNAESLLLKTGVSESDIAYVKQNDSVKIEQGGQEIFGKVRGVGQRPASGSNNYPVEIIFDDGVAALHPGMVVQGNIHSQTFRDVVYISMENLREKYGQVFVFIINSDNRAEMREVQLGEQVSGNIIIEAGLEPGDKLVTDGIDSLSENSLVDARSGFNSL